MTNETIMLAKKYTNPKQLKYPIVVQEKLDGVPANITNKESLSRQGETLLSIQHIEEVLRDLLPNKHHLVGELYIKGKPFKYISGLVRTESNCPELVLHVWDYYIEGQENKTYRERLIDWGQLYVKLNKNVPIKIVPGQLIWNWKDFAIYQQKFFAENPKAEGLIIRALEHNAHWEAGWRSPGLLKLKRVNTVDLKVVSFEEAKAADGTHKGMVGRINCMYKGKKIGVGPGNMTHAERTKVFKNQFEYINKIAEVKYMPDESYEALREPVFVRWRDDKQTESYE